MTDNADKDGYGEHVYDNDSDTTCNTCGYTRTLQDTQPPTGKIEIDGNSWTQFDSYGIIKLFFREAKQVTITAQDEGSGVDKIYYYISREGLYREEVEKLGADAWTDGNSFSIAPDKQCFIYVKITDKAGNITYLSSDGLIFDATPPVISGVTDGGTYHAPQTVTVEDAMFGVKRVTVNGTEVTLNDDQFTLGLSDNPQTIVAEDYAGNTTTVTVTVTVKEQTYAVTVQNGTGSGDYKAGATVTITANAPASGKQFDKWVINSGNVTLTDATSSTTTFTMPAEAVSVTATYKDKTTTGGGDSGDHSGGSGGNTGSGDHSGGSSGGNSGSGDSDSSGSHSGGGSHGGGNSGSGNNNNDNGGSTGDTDNNGASGNNDSGNGSSGAGTSGTPGVSGIAQPKVKQEKEGNIQKEVRVEGEETLDAVMETPLSKLADIVLTEKEKQQAAAETTIRIVLDVKDASVAVSAADRTLVETALNSSVAKGYTLGQYLDINLYKVIGDSRTAVTQTDGKITVRIDVPESLKNTDGTKTRTFAVLHAHDGKVQFLADLDQETDTITIETDRFSIYAIVYKDTAAAAGNPVSGDGGTIQLRAESGSKESGSARDDEPKTGDNTPIELSATLAMIAGFGYLLLYFMDKERGMTEERKKELVSCLVAWAKQGGKVRKYLALAAIFVLLVYYHSIGKKMCVEWKEVYGE